jgi:glutamyl-tRNA reductase
MTVAPRLTSYVFMHSAQLERAIDAFVRFSDDEDSIEFVPVQTCQRKELFVLARAQVPHPGDALRAFEGADAALRLFQVVAGVLSDIPGERAVALQVRRSIRDALRNRQAGMSLAKLFRSALRAGRVPSPAGM